MGEILVSNFVYSVLNLPGSNPYFNSCFHHIHQKCFFTILRNQ